jgi:uncharacterized protein (TIGR02284 family)
MDNQFIKPINHTIELLINSQEGFQKACDVVSENYPLRVEFSRRATARAHLARELQQQVRALGGVPADDGTMGGTMNRAVMEISSLFRKDEKAALNAIDRSEEKLANEIANTIAENTFDPQTRGLLERALSHAQEGEAFASRIGKIV